MVFANVRNIRWNYFRNIYGQAVLNVDCTKLTTKGVVQGAFVGCKHQSGEVIFNRKVKVIVIKNESTNRPIRLEIISNDGLAIDPADLFFSGLYYWTIGLLEYCMTAIETPANESDIQKLILSQYYNPLMCWWCLSHRQWTIDVVGFSPFLLNKWWSHKNILSSHRFISAKCCAFHHSIMCGGRSQ